MEERPMSEGGQVVRDDTQAVHFLSRLNLLGDERSFWLIAAWIVGSVSFLKGVRFPNLWSATEAQFDYRYGFIKRGFFGSYITAPLHLEHYARFTAFSFVMLTFALCLLIAFSIQSGVRNRVGHGLPVALFFGSFVLAYLGNLNGYFDVLLIVITLSLLMIRRSWIRFLSAIPSCVVALLMHEGFFLLLMPVVLFSFAVDAMIDRKEWKTHLFYVGVLAVGSAVLTFSIASRPSLSLAQTETFREDVASRIDFGPFDEMVQLDLFGVLSHSSADNRERMKQAIHQKLYQRTFIFSKVIFFPTVFLFLVLIARVCVQSNRPRLEKYGLYLSCAAALSPLSMNIFGYDAARWDTYVCLDAFLCLLVLVRALPFVYVPLGPTFRNASILVLMLSMATGEWLLDVERSNSFPFSHPLHNLTQYLRHDRWLPPFQLH